MGVLIVVACVGTGGAVAALARAASTPPGRPSAAGEWEPLVRLLEAVYRRAIPGTLVRAGRALGVVGENRQRPAEYLAVKHLAIAPAAVALGVAIGVGIEPAYGLAIGFGLLVYAPLWAAADLRRRANDRVAAVRERLPYVMDLMALVLEAGGASLHGCLRLAARENAGHALGEEFGRVVAAIDQGAGVPDAIAGLTDRLSDPDVDEVAAAVTAAETQGVPLKDALRAVAERLRVRQVLWMERASERAKVHITWPVMLIVCACLLIVAAPAVLGLSG